MAPGLLIEMIYVSSMVTTATHDNCLLIHRHFSSERRGLNGVDKGLEACFLCVLVFNSIGRTSTNHPSIRRYRRGVRAVGTSTDYT